MAKAQEVFAYAPGFHARVSAAIVGPALLKLAGDRGIEALHPREFVEDAKNPTSPYHAVFDWDDKTAAAAYRLRQAQDILRNLRIRVVYEDSKPQLYRPFVSLQDGKGYRSAVAVHGDTQARARLIQLALADVQSARDRLAAIRGFGSVVRLLVSIERAILRQQKKKAA